MNEKVSAKLFLLYRKNTKGWNLEEYQSYDDDNPLQSAKSKAISIWLTSFGLCVKWLTPLLMSIDSSKKRGNAK